MKNFCIAIVMTIIFFCGVLSGQTGETPTETPFITPAITLTPTKTNPKPTPTPYSKDKRFLKKYNYGTADERFGGLGFSPDGKSMYAATSTTHITRWNMDTGLAEKDYQYSINDASFSGPMNLSQDGAKLFICTNQNGVYHYVMWDTEEKKVLLHRSWDFEINKYQLFDNGNKCVIAARGNRVEILDIKQLQSTSRHFFPEYSRFLDIKVSPDEKYCAVAYSDGDNEYNARLVILNMNTMELIHDYELKTKSVNLISWLPDGTHIWVYGNTWKGNDFDKSNMDLLDTGTGDYVWHAEYSSGWRSIRFTRRGDTFLAFIENTLRVYNAFTGDILATMPHQSYITAAEFSPDEKSILTSTLDGMQTPISILWDIHDLGESPIPTLIPFTPTPTLTYTPTIPPVSQMYVNNIKTQSLGFMVFDDIETDPRNGDIYITKIDNKTITIRGPVSSVTGITGDVPVIATLTLQDDWYRDLLITTKGKFYVETLNGIYAILPDGSASLAYLYKKENIQYRFPLIEVKENAKISGAKPGDIIVILDECQDYETYEFTTSISALDLSGENPVLRTLSKERYPFLIREYAIGPEGYLYFLVNLDRAASRAIMRYELNGTFTKVHQIDPRWAADKMVYWPKDNAFYLHSDTFNSYNQFSLYRISMTDETPTLILGHYLIPFIMAVSSDGNALYLMGEIVKNQVFYGNFLEKLTLLSEFPTPSVTKKPEYFPTPVSTDYPIPTATGTPTPYIPAVLDESYTAIPLLEFDKYQFVKLGTKENSDEVVFSIQSYTGDGSMFTKKFDYYAIPAPQQLTRFSSLQVAPTYSKLLGDWGNIISFSIDHNGLLYTLASTWKYGNGLFVDTPEKNLNIYAIERYVNSLCVISSTAKAPGVKPGDIIAGKKLFAMNPSCAEPTDVTVSDPDVFTNQVTGLQEGPDGYLYFLYDHKIFYMDETGKIREYSHVKNNPYDVPFTYHPYEKVFYAFGNDGLIKLNLEKKQWTTVGPFYPIIPHQNRPGFYTFLVPPNQQGILYDVVNTSAVSTPTPSAPSPTPTPIAGWFVLDGFGGIHGTNPVIQRPVLPYWWNFNIARDIEPDPLGRGWYMLDGFGGIHTSSPDLPKPNTLPYFGFDIARNLKVKEVNGKLEFYLLDGYGVIHTTDPNFIQGNLPLFGEDAARCLKSDANSSAMLEMDVYGTIYRSDSALTDDIRFAPSYANSPVMRSFVRFPDDTTVMLDLFGGRHTNFYYPAKDVVHGLPGDFYFPGWDIIWDLELVPENLAKKAN